jgi:hypothetical protein
VRRAHQIVELLREAREAARRAEGYALADKGERLVVAREILEV